jgi:hypothetical protein
MLDKPGQIKTIISVVPEELISKKLIFEEQKI